VKHSVDGKSASALIYGMRSRGRTVSIFLFSAKKGVVAKCFIGEKSITSKKETRGKRHTISYQSRLKDDANEEQTSETRITIHYLNQ
jgi:hypothetical protein